MCSDDIPDQCMTELKATGIALVIDCERFSNTHKLYRVTALVLKFMQLLIKQATSQGLQDITRAEELWMQESQRGRTPARQDVSHLENPIQSIPR